MEIRFENEVYDLEISGLRKLLHEDVERAIDELDLEELDYDELEEIHNLISAQDVNALVDGFWLDGDINFYSVDNDEMLVDALKSAGYVVEKSNVSRSIYVTNDDGYEVRISDHIRPAIVNNGVYIGEHEYHSEIITNDNIITGYALRMNGFSKLNKNEYILG